MLAFFVVFSFFFFLILFSFLKNFFFAGFEASSNPRFALPRVLRGSRFAPRRGAGLPPRQNRPRSASPGRRCEIRDSTVRTPRWTRAPSASQRGLRRKSLPRGEKGKLRAAESPHRRRCRGVQRGRSPSAVLGPPGEPAGLKRGVLGCFGKKVLLEFVFPTAAGKWREGRAFAQKSFFKKIFSV